MKLLDLDDNEIIELYKTKSAVKIAKMFNVDHSTIYRRLEENNIKRRGLSEARILGGKKYKDLDINLIISLYESGESRRKLGKLFNVSPRVIQDRLVDNNIPLRNIKEAHKFVDQSGEKSSKWNGGRHKNGDGYVKIYKPEHPRASCNYVYEHHLVWEKENNKLLPEDYVIHHMNGIKDDNRIENLMAMSKKNHSRILAIFKERINLLEKENNELKEELKKYNMEVRDNVID